MIFNSNPKLNLAERVGFPPHSLAVARSFVVQRLRPKLPQSFVRRSLRYLPAGKYLAHFNPVRIPTIQSQIKNTQTGVFNLCAERVGFPPHSLAVARSFVVQRLRPKLPQSFVRRSLRYLPAGKYLAHFNPVRIPTIQSQIKNTQTGVFNLCAERVGFGPTVPVKVRQFSRLFHSTTLAPLLFLKIL